eukprot:TRINITY_DN93552_c0_g1_i1.p1 TRINITY_DN93552_c0_g1~~TRINITY_DN93552_c0_g1_i1.p1  ORF type:complete len:505 (-),score=65.49 TRINITY_DN93552_c0_g1_i1:67-1581(-)
MSSEDGDEWNSGEEDLQEEEDEDETMYEDPIVTGSLDRVEVLDGDTIVQELKREADKASSLLNLTTSAACKVMSHYGWSYDRLQDDYFSNKGLLERLGLVIGRDTFRKVTFSRTTTCPICLDDLNSQECWALLPCEHFLCGDCWRDTVIAAVRNGWACANLACPMGTVSGGGRLGITGCRSHVPEEVFKRFLPPEMFGRYESFVVRSFVETNPVIKWCRAPGCEKALRCRNPNRAVVSCTCGFKLCFKCSSEAHAPASCEQMVEWRRREQSESDNLSYITANAKPCPTCKVYIEKNEGCNHMTCVKCKAEGKPPDWCWVCGGIWDFDGKHGNSWYSCPFKDDESVKKTQSHAQSTATELYRYIRYYEGYANHKRTAELQASKDTERAEMYKSKVLESNPGANADHITEAVKAVVEARKYLQFTYIYSYSLDSAKQQFFDWKVKETEAVVTRLSDMMEDTYRHDLKSATEPKWRREQIMDTAALLKHRLKDLMTGVDQLEQPQEL